MASKLGRQYIGVDLRAEQIAANEEQAKRICSDPLPVWHCGDSREIDKHASGLCADLVFSCPPYADLEVYSDNPNDLSALPYKDFVAAYRKIIAKCCSMLKQDRFACFVVGEVRDKNGIYYNLVGDVKGDAKKATEGCGPVEVVLGLDKPEEEQDSGNPR